jgi:hypothetical protein
MGREDSAFALDAVETVLCRGRLLVEDPCSPIKPDGWGYIGTDSALAVVVQSRLRPFPKIGNCFTLLKNS